MNLHTDFITALKRRSEDKFNAALAMELLELARKVHRMDEDFCNVDFSDEQRTRREQKRDNLIEVANFIARELGALQIYHQADPRGWPLYLVFDGDIPDGEEVDTWYTRGLAVPPWRS